MFVCVHVSGCLCLSVSLSVSAGRCAHPSCAHFVTQIVLARAEQEDYVYYSIPAPWLTVKLLRLLQLFPFPGHTPNKGDPAVPVSVCLSVSVCVSVCLCAYLSVFMSV